MLKTQRFHKTEVLIILYKVQLTTVYTSGRLDNIRGDTKVTIISWMALKAVAGNGGNHEGWHW